MFNMLNKVFFILICINLNSAYTTQSNFINHKAEGWHWYEDRSFIKQDENKHDTEQESSKKVDKTITPMQIIKNFKSEMEKRLHTALVYPTISNMRAYQEIQKMMFERSEQFAKTWLQVVYTHPHLDYTIKHPVSQAARHVYLDQQNQNLTIKIKKLAQQFGLFFFFKSSCPYCHHFAPIVKSFSTKYGWPVLAISMDGSKLAEFPDAITDNGAAAKLNIEHLPTLLAVNPSSEHVIPLSYGMSSQDQIEQRITVLVKEENLK